MSTTTRYITNEDWIEDFIDIDGQEFVVVVYAKVIHETGFELDHVDHYDVEEFELKNVKLKLYSHHLLSIRKPDSRLYSSAQYQNLLAKWQKIEDHCRATVLALAMEADDWQWRHLVESGF